MADRAGARGRTRSRWNPVWVVGRSARRFRRRSLATKVRTVGVTAAALAGVVAYLMVSPSATTAGASSSSSGSAVSQASTSSRGVVGNTINVVFPVVSLNSLAGKEGFNQTIEFREQKQAINFFVGRINKTGGINGRKIHAMIVTFAPTNTTEMRALCKDWTQGSPPVFAVVEAIGTWTGTQELCVAQEGHTPMIAQWTTVTTWTKEAAPYLWWIGPDQAEVLQATVNWGLRTGLLSTSHKIAVVAGDRASDTDALKDYLLPDLKRAGVTVTVQTLPARVTETAETNADAPLVVAKLKAAGVGTVIPLLPYNAFFPYIAAEEQQGFFPHLLLSDYEDTIGDSITVLTFEPKALTGQEGVTTQTLGGIDDDRPQSQGGYDPGVRACFKTWHKAYPQAVGLHTPKSPYIEEQGPVQAWCTAIRLFATAAKDAGRNLNRRSFVEAMSRVKTYPGGFSPVLTYGPNKFYGPTKYQVVELHINTPPSATCITKHTGGAQGTCWVVKQHWKPLPTG